MTSILHDSLCGINGNCSLQIHKVLAKKRSDFQKRIDNTFGSEDVSYKYPSKQTGVLTPGSETYIFSSINPEGKYSFDYFDCTGLIGSGFSKKTGKLISFLSHQDPLKFLYDYKKEFLQDLGLKLEELRDLCYQGEIKVKAFGGKITDYDLYNSNYTGSIMLLRNSIRQILDEELEVLIGPNSMKNNFIGNTLDQSSHYFYENGNLHFYKPEQISEISNYSFCSGEVYDLLTEMRLELPQIIR